MPSVEAAESQEQYVFEVINRPLFEQTRITRIAKQIEASRDKTEFWMPAIIWRLIDYANHRGCNSETIYRVPGDPEEVLAWEKRFDQGLLNSFTIESVRSADIHVEYDIDLFHARNSLHINIVGSLIKSWLHRLPDMLFPLDAQLRIAKADLDGLGDNQVPQILKDELSNLSPFNYYTLFAVTCHFSLVLSCSNENMFSFATLSLHLRSYLHLDTRCFRFLILFWKDCWQGCKTEARYIEVENGLRNEAP
jgi:hypothetical protein